MSLPPSETQSVPGPVQETVAQRRKLPDRTPLSELRRPLDRSRIRRSRSPEETAGGPLDAVGQVADQAGEATQGVQDTVGQVLGSSSGPGPMLRGLLM
jgi:hypothetical protein